jgi:hypothetical protein
MSLKYRNYPSMRFEAPATHPTRERRRLWVSGRRPERVTCGNQQPGMIAAVSLRLLYLLAVQALDP